MREDKKISWSEMIIQRDDGYLLQAFRGERIEGVSFNPRLCDHLEEERYKDKGQSVQ